MDKVPFDSMDDYELVEMAEQMESNPPGEAPKVWFPNYLTVLKNHWAPCVGHPFDLEFWTY